MFIVGKRCVWCGAICGLLIIRLTWIRIKLDIYEYGTFIIQAKQTWTYELQGSIDCWK